MKQLSEPEFQELKELSELRILFFHTFQKFQPVPGYSGFKTIAEQGKIFFLRAKCKEFCSSIHSKNSSSRQLQGTGKEIFSSREHQKVHEYPIKSMKSPSKHKVQPLIAPFVFGVNLKIINLRLKQTSACC
jgi:hypothetical protein